MSYYDGFVIAVPTANKQAFLDHARLGDVVFVEHGATRVVECWGVDVPPGKQTDFQGAVQAKDDETIVFSWIEWPDKATRDAGMARMMDPNFCDPRMDPERNPMPFDGSRMIYGGFEPIFTGGDLAALPFVQGFIVPVPTNGRAAYIEAAETAWAKMFEPYGALCVLESWGTDVPEGKVTDFRRAVKATESESVVFSFMAWPSLQHCREAMENSMNDDTFDMADCMPFDGARMVYGGFEPILVLEKTDA